MGAAKFAKGFALLLLLAASTLEVSIADEEDLHTGFNFTDWWSRFGHYHLNKTRQEPKKIVVGGSRQWHFGFNYIHWPIQNAPFYINHTLDMVANSTQGGGEGFQLVLNRWHKPYYFACGERNGFHCKDGDMKFSVMPLREKCKN